jgi:hypothetical protein
VCDTFGEGQEMCEKKVQRMDLLEGILDGIKEANHMGEEGVGHERNEK